MGVLNPPVARRGFSAVFCPAQQILVFERCGLRPSFGGMLVFRAIEALSRTLGITQDGPNSKSKPSRARLKFIRVPSKSVVFDALVDAAVPHETPRRSRYAHARGALGPWAVANWLVSSGCDTRVVN